MYNQSRLDLDAGLISDIIFQQNRRVLLFGPMGIGKSTLAAGMADYLSHRQRPCFCVNADPGSPAFGIPGTVSLAEWRQHGWQVTDAEALCTLDAGRFRLPLVTALRSLAERLADAPVLIDAPGVVRGVTGRELLQALVDATAASAILVLSAPSREPPLLDELRSTSADVFVVNAAVDARRPGKNIRARQRTQQWDSYLANAGEHILNLARLNITGTPPLTTAAGAWTGKQIALLRAGHTIAMGEILHVEDEQLTVTLTAAPTGADTLLIRDAARNAQGYLETARPFTSEHFEYLPPADVLPSVNSNNGPRIVGRVGLVEVALVNGVFGDPLLHLRLRHQRRSILFDLGDSERLPARIAHQVTDVFISHAHMDHIGGFLWLLRSRIGEYPVCRLYGPPGLARHIAGFLQGILWDRIEHRNTPCFEVFELQHDELTAYRIAAGDTAPSLTARQTVNNATLLTDAGFRVRGISLDHHGTPVIAYAFEADQLLNVRKDRLQALQLEPGPWLNALKQQLLIGNRSARIQLPNGNIADAGGLGEELILVTPGKKLVYATDLGDTPINREKLIEFARHAHTFFCESAFLEADSEHAENNGHLTTRACGEIATAAGVSRLLPFHFSRRYLHKAEQLYEELNQYCCRVATPGSNKLFTADIKTEATIKLDQNDEC
jgi:ribonuclease BN (tRNA processing enzyme)